MVRRDFRGWPRRRRGHGARAGGVPARGLSGFRARGLSGFRAQGNAIDDLYMGTMDFPVRTPLETPFPPPKKRRVVIPSDIASAGPSSATPSFPEPLKTASPVPSVTLPLEPFRMVPIKLRGNNLGERHKELNTLVNRALGNTEIRRLYKDWEEASDVDRLFKIELAIKCRDVDYILATLKSDDMLYVSRALKATWLISDDEYSHIVNPEYLHTVLFPQMHNKAVCKLKFQIRQHLRSEERCELFYNYYFNELGDLDGSLVFLPYCTKDFILNVIQTRYSFRDRKKDKNMFIRITGRIFDLAEPILMQAGAGNADILMSSIGSVAISQTDHYLYLLEKYCSRFSRNPKLSKPLSKKIALIHPKKIVERLDVYLMRINLFSVGKVWPKKIIEELLDAIRECDLYMVRHWFSKWTIAGLLCRMSEEEKQVIFKKYFPDIECNVISIIVEKNRDKYIYETNMNEIKICPYKLHKWYEQLPFDTGFEEIKQLIRATMFPDDRCTLNNELSVLAGEDSDNLKQVLHYYFKTHINEQEIYKISFLDQLISCKKVHKFDEELWKYVNDLFISLEVYGNVNNSNYNEVIVFHDILNYKQVPDAIMEKYERDNHSHTGLWTLTYEERMHIYNYLITHFERKCTHIKAQEGITRNYYDLICNFISIVNLWQKCVLDYPTIIHAITEMMLHKPEYFTDCIWLYVYVVCFHMLNGIVIPDVIMENYLKYGYSNSVRNLTNENQIRTFDCLVADFERRTSYALIGEVDELAICLTKSFIRFLNWSRKSLADFPYLISLMKAIVVAVPGSLDYPSERAARRMLFDVSLLMSPKDTVLVDIMKHDATIINRHFHKFEKLMICKKAVNRTFLKKLSAYFNDDYAQYFKKSFQCQLKSCEKPCIEIEHLAYVTRNVSLIHKKKEFKELIQEYLPKNHKVEWGEEDMSIINIRKNIAKNLHQVRPRLDMDIVYEFAKGDYLQYALPSLLSVCMDAPLGTFAETIFPKFINSPVSVQKHGIRIAFKRLRLHQVSPVLQKMWSKSKNVSIRNTIFEYTFDLLIKQVKEDDMQVLWQLIKVYVNNLQEDEERTLLLYFHVHFSRLPKQFQCESFQICYREMERIKDKFDWAQYRNRLLCKMQQMLSEGMDLKYVSIILLENFNQGNISSEFRSLLVEFMFFGDEEQLSNNYESGVRPIFDAIVEDWNVKKLRNLFEYIFNSLQSSRRWRIEENKRQTLVLNNFYNHFNGVCKIEEEFSYHINMKLCMLLNEAQQETDFSKDIEEVIKRWAFAFSQNCEKVLNDMVTRYFPSIVLSIQELIRQFILNVCSAQCHRNIFFLSFADNLLREDSFPHNYLLGVYIYNRIHVDRDCDHPLLTRIKSIKNKEIQFHLTTKRL